MNDDATSLDRLHDLVPPPDVSWWPPAPGWYLVAAAVLVVLLVLGHRAWRSWQTNAYRRAALRELAHAKDAIAIAELLRRTALVVAPRQVIAEKTGSAWIDWLDRQSPEPLTDTVREQLTTGVYGPTAQVTDSTALRDFATGWITQHRRPNTKP